MPRAVGRRTEKIKELRPVAVYGVTVDRHDASETQRTIPQEETAAEQRLFSCANMCEDLMSAKRHSCRTVLMGQWCQERSGVMGIIMALLTDCIESENGSFRKSPCAALVRHSFAPSVAEFAWVLHKLKLSQ